MQLELRSFQQRLGITFIYVTHDQEEALTMSDRIVVMKGGEIQQVGAARAIYDRPANRFVADFIGETRLIEGVISMTEGAGGQARMDTPAGPVQVEPGYRVSLRNGQKCCLSIRPEKVLIGTDADNGFDAIVRTVTFRGPMIEYDLELAGDMRLSASRPAGFGRATWRNRPDRLERLRSCAFATGQSCSLPLCG